MRKPSPKNSLLKAKSTVYRLLKIRLRSEKEIQDRLQQKGFSCEIIRETIEYFSVLDLINDHVFTREWIRSRLRRPFGLMRIRLELIQKGISKDIVEEELDQIKDAVPEEEIVEELVKTRSRYYRALDRQKRKHRLYGYLVRRGFNKSIILKVLRKI